MKKLLIMFAAAMAIMTSPALARFDDPIVLNEIRGDGVFVCKNLASAISEIQDEIKAVKENLTPAQYWALLEPMIKNGDCGGAAMQYRPLEVLCKWTGASYKDDDTPLTIKTMSLYKIEVIVPGAPEAEFQMLYMITDKEGPDPVDDACESLK